MIFGIIGGFVVGSGAAYLQLQQPGIPYDLAITAGLLVVIGRLSRTIGGWGLITGVAAVLGMWSMVLGGGFIGTFDQTIQIYIRLIEDFPERWIVLMEDIAHYVSRYDLGGEIPAEGVMAAWGAEALAIVVAALSGAAKGKRRRPAADTAAPAEALRQRRGRAGGPWKSGAGAAKAQQRATTPSRRPAKQAKPAPARPAAAAVAPRGSGQPVKPVQRPTIVDTRRSRDRRKGGVYIN